MPLLAFSCLTTQPELVALHVVFDLAVATLLLEPGAFRGVDRGPHDRALLICHGVSWLPTVTPQEVVRRSPDLGMVARSIERLEGQTLETA